MGPAQYSYRMGDGSLPRYSHIIQAFNRAIWTMQYAKLQELKAFLEFKMLGGIGWMANVHGRSRAEAEPAGDAPLIAVIPVRGILSHRTIMVEDTSEPAGTSMVEFLGSFRSAMNNPNVSQIILDIDSPGGVVDGIPEAASEVFNARGTKPIVAVANTMAASAAYWIASQADEIVVTPSGEVGSIGVFTEHIDLTQQSEMMGERHTLISAGRYKVEGNPFEPLDDGARSAIQEKIDDVYTMFVNDVARGRGVKSSEVRNGFGEGRTVLAGKARAEGLADRVDTLGGTIARLQQKNAKRAKRNAVTGFEFTFI